MRTITRSAATVLAAALFLTACAGADGDDTTSEATTQDATTEATAAAAADTATQDTATAATTSEGTATTETATTDPTGAAPRGGPGGGVAAADVTSEAQLVTLIASDALGDGSLGLHRGHMPVESTLVEALGISHEELHVRMEEQGQNLAAVADDVGLGADELVDVLTASYEPAIDNLLAAGTIDEATAEQYREDLRDAFSFRVNWDGQQARPSYTGAGTLVEA